MSNTDKLVGLRSRLLSGLFKFENGDVSVDEMDQTIRDANQLLRATGDKNGAYVKLANAVALTRFRVIAKHKRKVGG